MHTVWLRQLAELAWSGASVVLALTAVLAAGHVVVHKRDSRSATGWVGLIVLVPLLGTVLYWLLGINRIRRRAALLRAQLRALPHVEGRKDASETLDPTRPHLRTLAHLMRQVTGEPLLAGQTVKPLDNGDDTYPLMLAAIDNAEHYVFMSTYIFESSGPGAHFIDALARAHQRGVEVRVLIDGVGARYGNGRADRELRRRGVRAALFLPVRFLGYSRYYNLRNHRKVLVVDGVHAFTGGINVRAGHVLADEPKDPIRDLHFELHGPINIWLSQVFAEDWEFATGETLRYQPKLSESLEHTGDVLARGIVDGPDADLDKIRWTFMGGLSCAQHSVRVVTPYFLPDSPLMSALNLAAMRGVRVDVLLPQQGNLRLVQWAMLSLLSRENESLVHYWLSPPPFDHSKVLVIDEAWSLIGSANWDPRSLRLNFEVAVECYDSTLARKLSEGVEARIARATPLPIRELKARGLTLQVRDGLARLLTPYL